MRSRFSISVVTFALLAALVLKTAAEQLIFVPLSPVNLSSVRVQLFCGDELASSTTQAAYVGPEGKAGAEEDVRTQAFSSRSSVPILYGQLWLDGEPQMLRSSSSGEKVDFCAKARSEKSTSTDFVLWGLENGEHELLAVVSELSSGGTRLREEKASFTVEAVPPVLTVEAPALAGFKSRKPTVEIRCRFDAESGFRVPRDGRIEVRLDGGGRNHDVGGTVYFVKRENFSVPMLSNGEHVVTLRPVDAFGNGLVGTGPPAVIHFHMDAPVGSVRILGPASGERFPVVVGAQVMFL